MDSTLTPQLPATLSLGPVHLVVRDLDRSLAWYEHSLGLHAREVDSGTASLGDVLVLHEDPQARPPGRHAGLYHYALLYPSREELSLAAHRLMATRTPIQGASDHGTHEAIYLPDPDGNGIELAADRPRSEWPDGLGYDGGPAPLDLESLLAATPGEPGERVGEGLRVGHLHLHVGDIADALAFYRDVLGFELQADIGTAAFVAAGGYHHHLAVNVWRGRGVPGPPPGTVGLARWTVELPRREDVDAVAARVESAGIDSQPLDGGFEACDPWGATVAFVAGG